MKCIYSVPRLLIHVKIGAMSAPTSTHDHGHQTSKTAFKQKRNGECSDHSINKIQRRRASTRWTLGRRFERAKAIPSRTTPTPNTPITHPSAGSTGRAHVLHSPNSEADRETEKNHARMNMRRLHCGLGVVPEIQSVRYKPLCLLL